MIKDIDSKKIKQLQIQTIKNRVYINNLQNNAIHRTYLKRDGPLAIFVIHDIGGVGAHDFRIRVLATHCSIKIEKLYMLAANKGVGHYYRPSNFTVSTFKYLCARLGAAKNIGAKYIEVALGQVELKYAVAW